MSKRFRPSTEQSTEDLNSAGPTLRPFTPAGPEIDNMDKLGEVDKVWTSIPEVKDFVPVAGGPKTKILKTVVLNFKPRVVLNIALGGACPQLRFTDDHHSFTMSGDDYTCLTGRLLGERGFMRVRLEPLEDPDEGFRLAKYNRTSSGMSELNPCEIFILNKYAARRLKTMHPTICDHVVALMASEEVTVQMVICVADVYKREYARLNTIRPIVDHFHELSRIVEMYIPAAVIVKAFLDRLHAEKLVSTFNHYDLLAAVLPQKNIISSFVLDP